MSAAASIRARLVMEGASRPHLAPHVRFRHDKVRDRWVVLSPERMFLPDEIGVEVLSLCDGERSIDAIIDALAESYAAPRSDVAGDVLAMIQDLADKGVLRA